METIMAWFAKKAVVAIVGLAALVAVPTAIVQTARLDGVHLLGLELVTGANDEVKHLKDSIFDPEHGYLRQLNRAKDNGVRLQGGLDRCNASVKALGDKKKDKDAELAALPAKIAPQLQRLQRVIDGLLTARPPAADAERCKWFDDQMKGAYP